jgi:predicted nucleic acid-binding protein
LKSRERPGGVQESKKLVLDSYAMIGYLENEAFSDRVQDLLFGARNGTVTLYFHMIHFGEVYHITLREQGQALADLAYSRVKALPLRFVDRINEELLRTAATLKATHQISYADSFAAAMAVVNKCLLLTGDPEFGPLEKEGVLDIEWLQ